MLANLRDNLTLTDSFSLVISLYHYRLLRFFFKILKKISGSGKPAEADTVVMTDQSDPEGGTWDDEEDATQYSYRYEGLHY